MTEQTGPQTIVVRQIVGEQEQQKVLDIHVIVPDPKPAIEQIVDVLVKNVHVNSVDIITDKVIVRGDLEVKAIYVACLPDLPVHAVEVKNYKWSQDLYIPGARKGMDAEAGVIVEFADYDIGEHSRAYKHKYYGTAGSSDDDECSETAGTETYVECDREFDVSIVLKITAKVMTDRQVQLNPPPQPQPMPPIMPPMPPMPPIPPPPPYPPKG